MSSGRIIVIIAAVLALIACGAIIGHFIARAPTGDPYRRIADLQSIPRLAPMPLPVAPDMPSPAVTPTPTPEPAPPVPTVVPPPPPPPPKTEPAPKVIVVPPRRLLQELFVYMPLPFDAPLAEFPLVLVWQKNRDVYRIRDFDMDKRLSPTEWDMLSRTRTTLFGDNPPTNPPPRPPVSPEESPSGL